MARVDADRNLLFGLLALQNNFIDRDALLDAFSRWVHDRAVPLGQVLRDRGALEPDDHEALQVLVARYLKKFRDDPEKSLQHLSSIGSVRDDLARIADADLQASLAQVAAARPDDDPHRTISHASLGASTSTGSRFRVLRPHARGGLGQVSVALDKELDRPVALKEIQDHRADEPESRARFVQEAEITGKLEHPGIIPVYGLGHDLTGRPYYAMRFIKGDSLKEAIAAFHGDEGLKKDPVARMSRLKELLRRFTDVCNAIAYAHSRGVLHRDLKPGNIMLGPYGETLVVDWGLAKPVGAELSGDVPPTTEGPIRLSEQSGSRAETQAGSPVGTPAYASPEQVTGAWDRLGPASDVYGLGATLYALLTGRAPVDGNDLGEVIGRVQRGEVPPPRSIDPAIPRPLEAICRKAMAIEPGDRYDSARALAKDVTRWLDDEPVSAYREPFLVRVGRWIRRHRTAVAGAAAALLAGLIGAAAMLPMLARANSILEAKNLQLIAANAAKERALTETRDEKKKTEEALVQKGAALAQSEESRNRAEAVLGFVKEDVLAAARPEGVEGGLGVDVTVRKALEASESKIAGRFKGRPIDEAVVRATLGATYFYLKAAPQAIRQFERAAELYDSSLGSGHPHTLTCRNDLALGYMGAGRFDDAIKILEPTLTQMDAKLGPRDPVTLNTRSNLAEAYIQAGRTADAIKRQELILKQKELELGLDHPDTLLSRNNLAMGYHAAGRSHDAIKILESTVKEIEAKLGPDHPNSLVSRNNLATLYLNVGRTRDAMTRLEALLQHMETKLGPDHPSVLIARNNLATAYHADGRFDDAIKVLQATLKSMEAKLGPDHPELLSIRNNLALAYSGAGRKDDAIKLHEAILARREAKLEPDHPDTLLSRNNLADAYRVGGRPEDAIKLLEMNVKLLETKFGPDHPQTLVNRANLAAAREAAGKPADTTRMEEVLKQMEAKFGPDHPSTLVNRLRLAEAYNAAGRREDAIKLLEAIIKLCEAKLAPDHPITLTARNNLAVVYAAAGRADDAIKIHEAIIKIAESRFGPDHPEVLTSRTNLAAAYLEARRTDDAIKLHEATLMVKERKLGPDDVSTQISRGNLAKAYRAAGQLERAISLFERAHRGFRAKVGPDHPYTLTAERYLVEACTAAGQAARAESLLRDRAETVRKRSGPADPATALALALLGANLVEQRKFAEAEPILRECLAIRQKTQPDDWGTFNTRSMLGSSLASQRKFVEAEPLVVQGYEGMKSREARIPAAGKPRLAEAAERVVRLYEGWGKPGQAEAWKRKLGLADLPADVFAPP